MAKVENHAERGSLKKKKKKKESSINLPPWFLLFLDCLQGFCIVLLTRCCAKGVLQILDLSEFCVTRLDSKLLRGKAHLCLYLTSSQRLLGKQVQGDCRLFACTLPAGDRGGALLVAAVERNRQLFVVNG